MISDKDKLPPKVLQSITDLETETSCCTGFQMNICLSYGSRSEIVNACKSVATKVASGDIRVDEINESVFDSYLNTSGIPGASCLLTDGYILVIFPCYVCRS